MQLLNDPLPSGSTIVAYRVEHESGDYDDYDEFYGYRPTLEDAKALRHFALENSKLPVSLRDGIRSWDRWVLAYVTISPVTI